MKAEYTANELSYLAGISRRAVLKRADAKRWGYREEQKSTGGSPVKYYITASIDPDFIARIAAAEGHGAGVPATTETTETTETTATLPAQLPSHIPTPTPATPGDANRRALARSDLVRIYTEAVNAAGWGGRVQARDDFMAAYNAGRSHPLIYGILGPVSHSALDKWKLRGDGALVLVDRRGSWKTGCRLLTAEQQDIVMRCVLNPNKPKITEAIRISKAVMASRGIANGHSERTYRRFINEWRSRNAHLWAFTREGKSAWNDECALSIERDYDKIGVGDLIVADGHVLNFEILSPWTGKPKRMTLIMWLDMKSSFPLGWEIMPTENTAAIAAALQRAILRLGKIPKVAYMDNGRAFGARFFNGVDLQQAGVSGLFGRLGIQTIFAWPYHGQSKTVERFFGTFSELERMCPTYTGTSIENKPPRLNRGERIHRERHARITGGNGLTMEQAHRAIAAWFDEYAQRPQRGHLNGGTPMEVFLQGRGPGVNKLDLVYLMMADESRTIHRSGIYFLGRTYYDPALYGRAHHVTIRYDLQDTSAIYVFDPKGEFICEARPVAKIHPAATVLGTYEDRAQLTEYIKIKKDQERQASAFAREFLESDILPQHNQVLASIGIEAGSGFRVQGSEKKKQLPMSAEEKRRIEDEVRQLEAMQAELPPDEPCEDEACEAEVVDESAAEIRFQLSRMSESDRYERLMDMEVMGQLMCPEYRSFMAYFELTDEYARHREYFEEKKAKLAAALLK